MIPSGGGVPGRRGGFSCFPATVFQSLSALNPNAWRLFYWSFQWEKIGQPKRGFFQWLEKRLSAQSRVDPLVGAC